MQPLDVAIFPFTPNDTNSSFKSVKTEIKSRKIVADPTTFGYPNNSLASTLATSSLSGLDFNLFYSNKKS